MSEELSWRIDADERASASVDQARDSFESMHDAAVEAAEGTTESMEASEEAMQAATEAAGDAGDETESMTDSVEGGVPAVIAWNQALELGQKALDAIGRIINEVTRRIDESTDAWREQRRVLRDLRMSYEGAGVEGAELDAKLESLTESSGDFADRTLIGNEAIEEAIATYQRLTPQVIEAETAHEDLSTILGIAEVQQQDAASAAETWGQAMEGNVRGLEKMTAESREYWQEVGQIEDASERAEIATEALRRQYDGAAEDVDGLALAQSRAENAVDDVRKVVGEMITENDQLIEGFERAAESAERMAAWVEENEEVIDRWITEAGALMVATLEELEDVGSDVGEWLTEFSDEADSTAEIVGFTTEMTLSFVESILTLADSITDVTSTILKLNPATHLQGRALEAAGDAAGDVAERLESVRDRAREIREERAIQREMDEWVESAGDAQAALEFLLDPQGAMDELLSGGDRATESIRGAVSAREDAADEARHQQEIDELRLQALHEQNEEQSEFLEMQADLLEIQQQDMSATREQLEMDRRMIEHRERINELAEERAQKAGEMVASRMEFLQTTQQELAEAEHRDEIAGLRLQKLMSQSELQEASIDRQIRMLELEQEDLSVVEERLRRAQIEADFEAEQDRLREERHERQLEKLRERVAAEQRAAEQIAQATDTIAGLDVGGLPEGLIQAQAEFRELQAAGESSAAALQGALGASRSAILEAFEAAGAGTRELAAIQAAMETANATAAGAAGNIPAAVAHGAAAGMYGAVAAGAGGGGGGGASASAGSAGPSSPSRPTGGARDEQRHQRVVQQATLEALREWDADGARQEVHIHQENSQFFEREPTSTQQTQRTLEQASSLSGQSIEVTE